MRLECKAESERKRKKWITRARRVGEWHRKREKAEERASGTLTHYISREEGGRTKRMRGENMGEQVREKRS